MADPGPTSDGGFFDAIRRVADAVLALAQRRFELLTLELQEEKTRALDLLVRAAALMVLGLLTLVTATATLVVALWDTSPVLVLAAVTLLYGAGAAALARSLRHRLQAGPKPFAGTLEELRKDRSCFGKPN